MRNEAAVVIRKGVTALGAGLLEVALSREGIKGCSPVLCSAPVALEPVYERFDTADTHHRKTVGEGTPTDAASFGEAKRILERAFNEDPYQDGYAHALQMALDGSNGGMRAVLNAIADTLKQRALGDYLDHVYYQHINVLSKDDNRALSRAFYERFGPILKRFGHDIDEDTFAWNTRAALDYHRQVLEHISGIAKKLSDAAHSGERQR